MKFMENTKINFMKFKSFGFGLSSVLAFGSIILLFMGVNLGIDFKGGTAIGVSFSENVSIQEVRGSLKSVSLNDSVVDLSGEEIKYFGSQSDVMIKIKSLDNEPENFGQIVINHLYDSMSAKAPDNKNDFILSLGSVSPKVGSELSGKAFWSVVSALVLILFYISVRFEFRFGLVAILALVHDVVITLAREIRVNPIINAEAVEAVLLGVLFEFSVESFPKIPKAISYNLSNKKTKGFVIEGVIIETPINITPAPSPTCCNPDNVGRSKKSYKTPNNIANQKVVTVVPKINLLINDLRLGVKVLSLIASIGLT